MDGYRILLVDDEEELRAGIRRRIDWAAMGFVLAGEAANGQDALELAEQLRPDVVLTDINDYRLELAHEVCEDIVTVNTAKQDLSEVMGQLGIGEGFDVGLEMSGNGSAFNTMINSMYNGGRIAVLGIQSSETVVPWNKIVWNCLEIKGIYGREMFETWYKMMSMLQSGLKIDKILTHKFDFRDFEEGFAVMNSGRCGKVVLDWTHAAEATEG